jgi:carboxymethylenebutenolidase
MTLQDIDSLAPSQSFNRRRFVQTSVGSGFAAAVLPVMAQTVIKTDTQGITVGEATITVGDHKMPVYMAKPTGATKAPVVLVVSEIFGVHEHIADVARRFAKQGYLAIAPELFVRQGDAGSYGEIAKLIAEVVSKVPDAQAMADLDACVAWADANGGDSSKLAVTGFCWGGRITWLYAAHQAKVKAGVAWYGRVVGDANPLQPKHPVDVAGAMNGPVLGLYGGQDTGIPLATVDRMKAALAAGGANAKKSEFHIYADAPHAFHADYRPTYRKEAADDGWKRCLAWFKANGVA